ncbi:hypothetical protein EYE40_11740 [Glaciihabitans arcticus]|uniref:Uncharacterized protein n=1 Tax=Glaciihabitans arcticus TaxID=2668039 RepID=A0A4Q9GTG2_9MICO|nr:hypothetical protein [Glaciihabitans arcticus]TBN58011.1 hypothetical protein EYE40_11740 [Glaciihabitans arcticus]
MTGRRRVRWWWVALPLAILVLVPVGILTFPILMHRDGGLSQQQPVDDWPLAVSAKGDDGRTRELMVVSATPGGTVDTAALAKGERIVVSGTGYNPAQGIYVAICVIPESPDIKPGPCLGGVPSGESSSAPGATDFAPSNWINDDWAWKLFGARGYDDADGTFTAYLEVPAPTGDGIDCTAQRCGIYTRNDHTALRDRVQDVYLPVAFD